MQVIGYDIMCVSVYVASSSQVLIACVFGQMLQDEVSYGILILKLKLEDFFRPLKARLFENSLYNTDWLNMTTDNRKYLLMLMKGTKKAVNIRAGNAVELNLTLFASVSHALSYGLMGESNWFAFQIMKSGVTLCAVMQAM